MQGKSIAKKTANNSHLFQCGISGVHYFQRWSMSPTAAAIHLSAVIKQHPLQERGG